MDEEGLQEANEACDPGLRCAVRMPYRREISRKDGWRDATDALQPMWSRPVDGRCVARSGHPSGTGGRLDREDERRQPGHRWVALEDGRAERLGRLRADEVHGAAAEPGTGHPCADD